jgi:PHP family Zn ribbon phosphoesterase
MNWQVPDLADKTIVSFSDAHSLSRLGRELTVFQGDRSYKGLADALMHHRVAYTVEFFPEEGKYHYNGHRKCGICLSPEDTQRQGSRCPVCGRPLTLGVLHRTRQLSGSNASFPIEKGAPDGLVRSPQGRPPFTRLVPLLEIIAETLAQGPTTKRVQREYLRILQELGSELKVLLQVSYADLEAVAGEHLAQAILRVRASDIQVEPGYDGLFGRVRLWPQGSPEGPTAPRQSRLAGL